MSNEPTGPHVPRQPPPSGGSDNLHAPWRLSYMDMLGREPAPRLEPPASDDACFLREYWLHPELDEQNHVIVRTGTEATGRGGMILLNKYPYANGHLLVALGAGRARLMDYTPEQRAELWSMVDLASDLAERALQPQGLNVGVNQGMAAGAGVPQHLHVHVVPRWAGDVNFMAVVGRVRVIPSALEEMARRYLQVWQGMQEHLPQ